MKCKAKSAAHVNVNMPQGIRAAAINLKIYAVLIDFATHYFIDKCHLCGIYIFTKLKFLGGRGALKERQQTLESPGSFGGRGVESCTGKGSRSQFPAERVLRSVRYRAGQVRDVAPCVHGERAGNGCHGTVWGFQADVLSSQSQLRQCGDCRAGTEKTWSSRPPQTPGRSLNVSREPFGSRRTNPRAKTGHGHSAGIRSRCASEDDRASTWRKKNSQVKSGATEKHSAGLLTSILAQYETLRIAALGGPLPPESRNGLGLLLRKGMWAWARAVAVDKDHEHTKCSFSSTSIASHQHKAVIQIFAAMALNVDYRRMQ